MSEKPKKKPEFFKMQRSNIDWSDPDAVSEAMERIYKPFDFDHTRASQTEDSPETADASLENASDAPVDQKS